MARTGSALAAYEAALGELTMDIDGVRRQASGWPEWAITTCIDTAAYWPRVWQAITCHQTQLPGYESLKALPEDHHRCLWGSETYYRVASLVNGGRKIEQDLFAGLR